MPVPPAPYQDYVPGPDADFAAWATALAVQYALGTIDPPSSTAVSLKASSFQTALDAATSGATRGPATIAAKDAQRVSSEATMRLAAQAMVNAYKNGDLTAAQLTDAGVRVPSEVQTPRMPPATGPDLGLRQITPGQLSVTVVDPMSGNFRKPIGVVAAEIWSGLWSGDPLVPPTSYNLVQLATRKVNYIDTTGTTGEKVRYRARWVTVRGANSPFGADLDAISA